ncbi:MAG: hypothetical protein NTW10_14815 [Bacteroidetes bacterium]|nr:hypothetical protein [Bacteroidota bacterium]
MTSLISCKKNKTIPDTSQTLFTVELADNFIKKDLYGFILVSDPQGNYLGDTLCQANGRYPVFLKSAYPVPSQVAITVGYVEIIMHTLTVHLNTYTGVAPYGEWKMKGNRPDTLGNAVVSLTNLPVLTGPVIYSNSGYTNMTFKTTDKEQMMYVSPDDLYIKIMTLTGDKFKIVPGITLSGNYSVDMADAVEPANHTISFPMMVLDYDISVSGYKGANLETSIPFLTDRIISDGSLINKVDLDYPPSVFTGFITEMMIRESYTSDLQWFNHADGDIPDQFLKINAVINSVSANSGQSSINASGTFMMFVTNWQYTDKDNTLFDWNIFGPETSMAISLPSLSPNLQKSLPTLMADSMQYTSTELRFYPNLKNYQDILGVLYDKDRNRQPGDFEMRSVRKNAVSKRY